jgi:methanethiol S-methyltransferase
MESEAQFTRRILDVSDPAHPKEAGRWSMPGQKEGEPLRKILSFCYGLLAYVVFLGAFLYAIGFVTGLAVPKTVDTGEVTPVVEALVIDILLLSLFAVQHSVMARPTFKRWWTHFVPVAIERSTYVLLASLALILLFWQWRPIPLMIWQATNPAIAMALLGLSLFGWFIVLLSTFLINHFELFGLQQVISNLSARAAGAPRLKTPFLYNIIRHPIYLGFIIAFWATPAMTGGHLLFAVVTTAYILVGIALEERDMIEMFGDEYQQYRRRVAMLVPWLRM